MSQDTVRLTKEEAVQNAARLLRNAETETDRGLMRELVNIADSWIVLAREAVL